MVLLYDNGKDIWSDDSIIQIYCCDLIDHIKWE